MGDARPILQALVPLVQWAERPEWMAAIGHLKAEHPSLAIPASDSLLPQQVLAQLNETIQQDDDAVVVTGVGQHQMWAAQYLFLNRPNSFVTSGGLGVMGFEVPAALGAQLGRPGATVWSVAGDGGFQMTLQELVTAVQEKLPIKIALFNNGYLGMVRQWQEMFFEGHLKEVPMPGPDYVKLARRLRHPPPSGWNIRRTSPTPCARRRNVMARSSSSSSSSRKPTCSPWFPPAVPWPTPWKTRAPRWRRADPDESADLPRRRVSDRNIPDHQPTSTIGRGAVCPASLSRKLPAY